MTAFFKKFASTRLTLSGFATLGLALVAMQFHVIFANSFALTIIGLLTFNLACALIVTRRLRREPGLLIFHLALLLLLIAAGVGRLTHFDGHVEVLEGSAFSPAEVVVDSHGPFHPPWLQEVTFFQGPFTVDYAPGIKRARTKSEILVDSEFGPMKRDVGDDVAFITNGFRFYTTHNKGVAVVLTWLPTKGEAMTGAVHMPGYPLFDWKQDNRWQAPGGPEIRFWLHLDTPLKEDRAWTLASDKLSGMLVLNTEGRRIELRRGESVSIGGGALRFDELRGWMGYRVFFDPTLSWLLGAAIVAVFGLALQFLRKPVLPQRRASEAPLPAKAA
jgi:hypothetical protein